MTKYTYYLVLLIGCIVFSCNTLKKKKQNDTNSTVKEVSEDKGKFSSSDPVIQTQELHKTRPPRPDRHLETIKQLSDSIFLYIEKTPCYGKCPTYSAYIYPNGDILFDGKRFVNKEGMHKGKLTIEDINALKTKIQEVNYFEFNDIYDSSVTDLPSTYTMINLEGRRKVIKSRHNVPETLRNFEKYINQLVLSYSWLSN